MNKSRVTLGRLRGSFALIAMGIAGCSSEVPVGQLPDESVSYTTIGCVPLSQSCGEGFVEDFSRDPMGNPYCYESRQCAFSRRAEKKELDCRSAEDACNGVYERDTSVDEWCRTQPVDEFDGGPFGCKRKELIVLSNIRSDYCEVQVEGECFMTAAVCSNRGGVPTVDGNRTMCQSNGQSGSPVCCVPKPCDTTDPSSCASGYLSKCVANRPGATTSGICLPDGACDVERVCNLVAASNESLHMCGSYARLSDNLTDKLKELRSGGVGTFCAELPAKCANERKVPSCDCILAELKDPTVQCSQDTNGWPILWRSTPL